MNETLQERVRTLLDQSGKSAAQLTREHGLGRTLLYDVLSGKTKQLSSLSVSKLSRALHVKPDMLLVDANGRTIAMIEAKFSKTDNVATDDAPRGRDEVRPSFALTRRAVVDGKVEAGSWRQVDDFDQSERRFIDVPSDEEFPNARIRVFEIAGDSMDAYTKAPLKPGALAVCIDYEDIMHRMPKRNGMVVVVERIADGGQFRERSIKELEVHDDHLEFHPRSTNPAHKPFIVPIDYEADDGVRVHILAVLRRIVTETIRF